MGTGTGKSLDVSRRTALYRLYNADDELLYIGIGFNPRTRWYNHKATKTWWDEVARREVEWYPDRVAADAAERAAILEEQPRYNVARKIETPPPKPPRIRAAMNPDTAERLRMRGRAYGRAKRAEERARAQLAETIRRAAADGIGPAEIYRLIGRELTERTVYRILSEDKATA